MLQQHSSLFPYTTLFRSPLPDSPSASPRCSSRFPRCCLPLLQTLIRCPQWSSSESCSSKKPPLRCSRSEEHTSELQSHSELVCRLLLEKKKKSTQHILHK